MTILENREVAFPGVWWEPRVTESEGLTKTKMKNQEIRLCCGGKGCPTVKKTNKGTLTITDDSGNSIEITTSEAKLLPNALKQLKITS